MSRTGRRFLSGSLTVVRCAVGLVAVAVFAVVVLTTPSRATRDAVDGFRSRPMSLDVRDRHGERIALLPTPDGTRREFRALADTPPLLIEILVASEDHRFVRHHGIDIVAVGRAAWANLRAGRRVSGASTITMQLARLIRPHGGGRAGKRTEMRTALQLERLLSKDEILELWLNSLPFSQATEGVSAGARVVFGVSVDQLSAAQMVLLAVMPRSPGRLHPGRNPEQALAAAQQLAHRLGLAVLPADLARAAQDAALIAAHGRPDRVVNHAPHAVAAARAEYRSLHGTEPLPGHPLLLTLDLAMQRQLEAALSAAVTRSQDRRIAHAAALVIDHTTGAVLAWVGSANPSGSAPGDQIDGVRVRKPSGSTLKPFLYALAIDRGTSVDAALPNHRAQFGATDEGAYLPVNFSRRFSESVPLATALASSLNVPAVFLTESLGVATVAETFGRIGFADATERVKLLGHGIAVGNTEVSPWELTRAFTLFARGGTLIEPFLLANRNPVVRLTPISAPTATAVARILADPHARAPGFGVSNPLATRYPAIFKTGTASQFSDIWAVGSTARLTAVVWMGNHTGATVSGETGSSLPARILADFFAEHVHPLDPAPWALPPAATANVGITDRSAPAGSPADVGHAGTATIRFPADGSVFLFDPGIPAEDQGVPVVAVGGTGTMLSLVVSGAVVAYGVERVRTVLQLPPGEHQVQLLVDGTVKHHITVRVW
ncbi:MAG: penicillin-binding protein [Spirochaetaceae bacterium]|nr:MAG: penicillin-binding protein [Spirochaetaceae bacterium]